MNDQSRPVLANSIGYTTPAQHTHTTNTGHSQAQQPSYYETIGYPLVQSVNPVAIGYPLSYYETTTGYSPEQPSYNATTAGGAYPYIAPPPPTADYDNPNPNPVESCDEARRILISRILMAVSAGFFMIAAISFTLSMVLVVDPEFQVHSVSIAPFNVSDSPLTSNWDIGLSVINHNKKISISYSSIDATVVYQTEILSETSLEPFYQGKRNQTVVQAEFGDVMVAKYLASNWAGGSVIFNMKMVAWIEFTAGSSWMRRHLMRVLCEGVTVEISSNNGVGVLNGGGSRKCKVHI